MDRLRTRKGEGKGKVPEVCSEMSNSFNTTLDIVIHLEGKVGTTVGRSERELRTLLNCLGWVSK